MAAGADSRIGSESAGYRIERLPGRGGMSVVYLAYDPGLERRVALKLISPELSEDESFQNRFSHRVATGGVDRAPECRPGLRRRRDRRQLYIAMRYMDGTDLKVLLKKEGALDPERALNLVSQAAEGSMQPTTAVWSTATSNPRTSRSAARETKSTPTPPTSA